MLRVERGGVNETIVGKIQLGSHRSFFLSSRMERAKVVQREIFSTLRGRDILV